MSDTPSLADQKTQLEIAKLLREEQQARVTALIPDLSKITGSEVKRSADAPLYAGRVAAQALSSAAGKVSVPGAGPLVVTASTTLFAGTAAYRQIEQTAVRLASLAEEAVGGTPAPDTVNRALIDPLTSVALVGGALANLLPAVVNLFATTRTISVSTVETDGTQVAMVVANELRREGRPVSLDGFRPLHANSPLLSKIVDLQGSRVTLARRAAELATLKKATAPPTDIDDQIAKVAAATAALDSFFASLSAASGTTTALVAALLYENVIPRAEGSEESDDGDDGPDVEQLPLVVLVSSGQTTVTGLVNDKRFGDSFSTHATASITYSVVDPATGLLVAGGTATGESEVHGKIGRPVA